MEQDVIRSKDPSTVTSRPRTSNRLRYEAEKRVIQARIGSLEEIRAKLGLSRRKVCQLLLVDPSAWSRWTSAHGDAPPHIFRALEWYLMLIEKDPRALMPVGSWSSTAFEDRFQFLEAAVEKSGRARAGLMAAVLMVGLVGGAVLVLVFH